MLSLTRAWVVRKTAPSVSPDDSSPMIKQPRTLAGRSCIRQKVGGRRRRVLVDVNVWETWTLWACDMVLETQQQSPIQS